MLSLSNGCLFVDNDAGYGLDINAAAEASCSCTHSLLLSSCQSTQIQAAAVCYYSLSFITPSCPVDLLDTDPPARVVAVAMQMSRR